MFMVNAYHRDRTYGPAIMRWPTVIIGIVISIIAAVATKQPLSILFGLETPLPGFSTSRQGTPTSIGRIPDTWLATWFISTIISEGPPSNAFL